jgi:FAD/FMN-containing dehydrogenase
MREVHRWLADLGVTTLTTSVLTNNSDALRFYKRLHMVELSVDLVGGRNHRAPRTQLLARDLEWARIRSLLLVAVQRCSVDWKGLRAAIGGEVLLPGSAAYESARKPFFARFHDVRPRAIVFCTSPSDVSEAVGFAARSGVKVVTRSGGHCFAGRSAGGGIVIDVSPIRSVTVSSGIVTVGAGARLGEVYEALAGEGVTIPAGSCPSVGIAGLTLGGGLGILGRMYGVTSDHLESAQIVLGDGRLLECDDRRNADLFWALRGGGAGSFGVVTELRFGTRPQSPATNFRLAWAEGHAATLIRAWQDWAPSGPDELYVGLLLSASGEAGQAPSVELVGSMFDSEGEAHKRLDEFLASCGADPIADFREGMSFRDTTRFWAGLDAVANLERDAAPQELQHGHTYIKSEFFRQQLPDAAITGLLTNFATPRVRGEARELDFTPWGGAYNRMSSGATAFAHREELFSLKHTVVVDPSLSSAAKESARRWLDRSWSSVRPWGSGCVFPNFPDPTLEDPGHAYYAANYERLLRIKAKYDPGDVFPAPA